MTIEIKLQINNNYDRELTIKHNDEILGRYTDNMDELNCSFVRRLSWVPVMLQKCYEAGKKDALTIMMKARRGGKSMLSQRYGEYLTQKK